MSTASRPSLDSLQTLDDLPLAALDPELALPHQPIVAPAPPQKFSSAAPPQSPPLELAPLDAELHDAAPAGAPPTAVGSPPPPVTSAMPGARIDRDFVLKNQLVERYLAGRLPLRGARDLERFCRENPQLLDEIQLEKNIQAALRLLESSGHSSPWEPPVKSWWERPQVPIAAAVAAIVFACSALVSHSQLSGKEQAIAALKHQMSEQPLEASTSTRSIKVMPSRTGPTSGSLVTIGGGEVQMADLKFDVSWTPLNLFRVTIDRVGQGRVGILHNVQRDSNGNLHIELNSSALGPGDYQFTIEGLNWKGEPIPQAWATISLAR